MAIVGKIRSLTVRPIQSVDLAFSVSGTIAAQNDKQLRLGQNLTRVDLESRILNRLGETLGVDAGPARVGRLRYTVSEIQGVLAAEYLLRLTNDSMAASLDQAILRHHNLYLERYQDGKSIVTRLRGEHATKLAGLKALRELVRQRTKEVDSAYVKPGVVTETRTTTGYDKDAKPRTITYTNPIQMVSPPHTIQVTGGGIPGAINHAMSQTSTDTYSLSGGAFQPLRQELKINAGKTEGFISQVAETEQEKLVATTPLVDFKHPALENKIVGEINRLELEEELSTEENLTGRYANLETIWNNDKNVIDLEVRKLQVAYLDTYLLSPIDGVITGIFKDVGETVNPGEAVLRVENDNRLLLVGFVQCRRALNIGGRVSISCRDIYESGDSMEISGEIRAVRGHEADDDEWDVIIEVDNSKGQPVKASNGVLRRERLPLNFHFDRDTSRIEFQ